MLIFGYLGQMSMLTFGYKGQDSFIYYFLRIIFIISFSYTHYNFSPTICEKITKVTELYSSNVGCRDKVLYIHVLYTYTFYFYYATP